MSPTAATPAAGPPDDGGDAVSADTGLPDEEGLPRDRPRGILRKIVSGLLSFGVVALIFAFLIPKLLGSGATLSTVISSINTSTWIAGLLLGLVNIVTFWPPIVVGLPGLKMREAGVTNTAAAALSNTVPEGGAVATALTYAMQRSWGFALEHITLGFMATGIWTNFVRYGLFAVGLVVLTIQEPSQQLAIATAIVVVLVVAAFIVFVALLRSEHFARWLGTFAARLWGPFARRWHWAQPDMVQILVTFRTDLIGLVQRRWPALTVTMFISQLSTIVLLGTTLRLQGVGVDEVSWARIVVAYGGSSLAALLLPVPGGMGVVEAALLAILGAGESDAVKNQIIGAIVVYRGATWLLPIPIGSGSYLFWRYNRSWRRAPDERDPNTGVLLHA